MSTEIYYSTNPLDWEQLEALYVAEQDPPGFITGVNMSTVGMAGQCVRGPLTPQEITSPARFIELYGERDYGTGVTASGSLVGQVWAALLNKKFGKLVIRRVAASDAVKATVNLSNAVPTAIVRVDAANVGIWANGATGGITVSVENATDGNANHFNLRAKYLGKEYLFQNLNTFTASDDNLAQTLGTDPAVLITVTKLANGRPVNVTDTPLASGSNGTVTNADYSAGITDIAYYKGISVCLIPEAPPTPATVAGTIVNLAQNVNDRVFVVWAGTSGNSVATEKTALTTQITTRRDRIVWCYNTAQTLDPKAGTTIVQGAHVWLASVMSQTHPSVHKGEDSTRDLLGGITAVTNDTLSRQDLIDLRAAGISTLEHVEDGFKFHSVVTTDLTPGKTELSRRLMTDFIQNSLAARLRKVPKSKNTAKLRAKEVGEIVAFLHELQQPGIGQTIDDDDPDLGPGFLVDKKTVNTGAQRARGLEFTLVKVREVNHVLYEVLETEMGTGVVTVLGG